MDFSVLISVYKNDKADDFSTAIESLTKMQSVKPSEVVLVIDGPIPGDVNKVISDAQNRSPKLFNIIKFEHNQGLGVALKKGIEASSNEIVMRMDSDDIALPDRFEKQLAFMEQHPDVAVCGGQISEFVGDANNIVGRRVVPCTNDEIYHYMKSRCAFNHMTVALRRSEVLKAGNYQPWFWNEDYYLWVRMMIAGCQFANLPDTLVNVRVGKDMYARRGSLKYFKSEAKLQKYIWGNGVISFPRYTFNVLVRLCVQVLMPNWLRGFLFQKLFRR